MPRKTKLRRIGRSLGFVVPKGALHELGLQEGNTFYVVRTPNGVELTRCDPDHEAALNANQDFMRRYPNAMKKLASGKAGR